MIFSRYNQPVNAKGLMMNIKILRERICPCCGHTINYQSYLQYLESNSGEGSEPVQLSCANCNHIILSTREHNKWSEGTHLFMLYVVVGLLYFVDYTELITYIIYGILLVLWFVLEEVIPFLFVKLQCYTDDEVQKFRQKESETPGLIILLGVILFFSLIFFMFYTLMIEYDHMKKHPH